MSIVSVLLALAICGFLTWLVLQIPMPQIFRSLIVGLVIVFLVVFILQHFGIATGFPRIYFR